MINNYEIEDMDKYPMIEGISFVIPAYNEEASISFCIHSIQEEMLRNWPEFVKHHEIIVVDNASTDNTGRVAEKFNHSENFPVRVIREEKKGIVNARLAGSKEAKYPFVAFIDADSRMPRNWAFHAIIPFILNPKVVAVSGPVYFYDMPWYINVGSRFYYFWAKLLHLLWPTLQGGNYIIRQEVMESSDCQNVEGFEFWGEDTMIAVKLSKFGTIRLNPKMYMMTSGRRLKKNGIWKTTWKYIVNYFWASWRKKPYNRNYEDIRS